MVGMVDIVHIPTMSKSYPISFALSASRSMNTCWSLGLKPNLLSESSSVARLKCLHPSSVAKSIILSIVRVDAKLKLLIIAEEASRELGRLRLS